MNADDGAVQPVRAQRSAQTPKFQTDAHLAVAVQRLLRRALAALDAVRPPRAGRTRLVAARTEQSGRTVAESEHTMTVTARTLTRAALGTCQSVVTCQRMNSVDTFVSLGLGYLYFAILINTPRHRTAVVPAIARQEMTVGRSTKAFKHVS